MKFQKNKNEFLSSRPRHISAAHLPLVGGQNRWETRETCKYFAQIWHAVNLLWQITESQEVRTASCVFHNNRLSGPATKEDMAISAIICNRLNNQVNMGRVKSIWRGRTDRMNRLHLMARGRVHTNYPLVNCARSCNRFTGWLTGHPHQKYIIIKADCNSFLAPRDDLLGPEKGVNWSSGLHLSKFRYRLRIHW